jgi:hypothetical protein
MFKNPFGKSRAALEKVKSITSKQIPDLWVNSGLEGRFKQVYVKQLKNKPLNFLKNNFKNSKPNIMILGAGFGGDIIKLNEYLTQNKIKSKIDVFSLHKMIDLSKNIIREDYSQHIALEELFFKNKQTFGKIINKYNLVVAPLSVGVHTKYPVYNALCSAVMLKKKGVLYYEVPIVNKQIIKKLNKHNKDVNVKTIFSKLNNFEVIFDRMVTSFNKIYSVDIKFKLNLLESSANNHYVYYEIKRTK